jgi:hypothetical protein
VSWLLIDTPKPSARHSDAYGGRIRRKRNSQRMATASLEIKMATYSEAQHRALLNADLDCGHLRLTDSAGNRVHGMTLRTLQRHGLIERLWRPIPLTAFGAAEALRLHDAQGAPSESQCSKSLPG